MFEMASELQKARTLLQKYLVDFLAEQNQVHAGLIWSEDVFQRLTDFATTGKLVRGSSVLVCGSLFGIQDIDSLLAIAAAMELMHSSGLIHDDITDHDSLRRGKASIYAQYQSLADQRRYQGERVGEGLAIWVGDIGFFLAFRSLGKVQTDTQTLQKLMAVYADEYIKVGLGQLHDMHLGLTPEKTTEDEILSVYRVKTARYTMALPLLLTAILAKTDETVISKMVEVAETIGIIFQLKDDELGLFGTEAEIGKPIMSDVREGKKTLYYLWGLELATPEQRQQLQHFFGNPALSEHDQEVLKHIIIETGARQKVDDKIAELESTARAQIEDLAQPQWQSFFQQLLAMNLGRTK